MAQLIANSNGVHLDAISSSTAGRILQGCVIEDVIKTQSETIIRTFF